METKQKLGLAGSFLLIAGVFTPVMTMPIVGSLMYIKGDGIFLLIIGIIALALSWFKKYIWLAIPSVVSLAIMIYTIVNFHIAMSEMKEELAKDLAGNPFAGLGELAMHSVRLEWGWSILFLGAILIGLASFPVRNKE